MSMLTSDRYISLNDPFTGSDGKTIFFLLQRTRGDFFGDKFFQTPSYWDEENKLFRSNASNSPGGLHSPVMMFQAGAAAKLRRDPIFSKGRKIEEILSPFPFKA
jgi:hypothetical protein